MSGTAKHDSYPVKAFSSGRVFENWLAKHHSGSEGIWIRIAKAATGIKSVTYAEALDIALCYGWIDGLRRSFDERYFVQKFTPRTKNSPWSAINKNKVAGLIEAGRMMPAGHAAIEAARKNGQWNKA